MSRSFHDDFILQDQASSERSQDQWSSGTIYTTTSYITFVGVQDNFCISYQIRVIMSVKCIDI